MTARTRQRGKGLEARMLGQDWRERTAGTEHLRQDSWGRKPERTDRTEQPEQNSQNRTAGTEQPGQNSQDKTAGTGQPQRIIGIAQYIQDRKIGLNSQNTLARTDKEQPWKDSHDRMLRQEILDMTSGTGHPGQVSLDYSNWQVSLDRSTLTGQPGQVSLNRSARTSQPRPYREDRMSGSHIL
jgi:hypothetical protein